jgi:Na+/H+ antiporter NhaD/arsenite permease-like protein
MIGSAAQFSFNDFLTHSLPVVAIAWLGTLLTLKIVYRNEMKEKPQNIEKLMKMNEKEAITDPRTLKIIVGVLVLVVALFFFHNIVHIKPSFVALIGAALALVLVAPKKDPQKIFEKVELSVLVFFASLFVIVGGLESSGALDIVAEFLVSGAEENIVMTAITVLWMSAILSALVDNIPFTVAMIPVIAALEAKGMQVNILWWALLFGVGFGGNGSPIGSTANVIVVSKSEQTDTPITLKGWLKGGTSVMLVTCVIATIALVSFSDYFNQTTNGQTVAASHETSQEETVNEVPHGEQSMYE